MTNSLPFEISRGAERYIRDCLQPQPGREAALVQTFNLEARDKRGRVYMRFPGEFFTVGYVEPAQRPTAGKIELFGVPVSVAPQTLSAYAAKRLRLKSTSIATDGCADTQPISWSRFEGGASQRCIAASKHPCINLS